MDEKAMRRKLSQLRAMITKQRKEIGDLRLRVGKLEERDRQILDADGRIVTNFIG